MPSSTTSAFSRRTLLSSLALAGSGLVLSGCMGFGWERARFTETRTLSLAHVAGRAIDVQTDNGAISVSQGTTSEVSIIAKLRATTQERLTATVVDAARDVDGKLVVRVIWPEQRKGNEGCEFTITLPDAVGASLTTSNGAITISGLAGDAVLKTSNGAIEAKNHGGPVIADTSNGKITVNSASGSVSADTSNGAITLIDVGSPVKADTSNGAIKLVMLPTAEGPINLDSSNGAIDVAISPVFAGTLTADTNNGGLTLQGIDKSNVQSLRRTAGVLVFGDTAAGPSRVDTSNGGITIRVRGQ
ncbi:MAG: DUF4097 family beta strand repeat protein [Phycisphaerales bacterium]|nr:DUF4097 family beta strand repeat protein [Phycisphaerales bacterium]